MDEIQIRQATILDLEKIVPLFSEYRVFYKQTDEPEKVQEFLLNRFQNLESVIFIAVDSDSESFLGFTQLYPTFSSISMERSWILNDLYVTPAARKLGVGKKLIETAKVFVIHTKAKGLALSTAQDNFIAQKLYESLGFVQDKEFLSYFWKA